MSIMDTAIRTAADDTAKVGLIRRILGKMPELTFEVLCMVISILLALWVGMQVDAAKDRKLALKALGNFKEELQANRQFMSQSLPLHKAYIEKLRRIQPPINSWNDINRQLDFTGLGPSSAYSTAWETAVATLALVQIDYDTVKRLSGCYLRQRYVEVVRQKFLDIFYNPATFLPENAPGLVQSMYFMFQDLVRVQENMIRDYDEVLKRIDERYPDLKSLAPARLPPEAPLAAPTLPAEAG